VGMIQLGLQIWYDSVRNRMLAHFGLDWCNARYMNVLPSGANGRNATFCSNKNVEADSLH